nr:hypothetical protein [Tanacetum cinerariifolium]
MSKTQVDYRSGVARPKIEDKDNFELKGQFLKELRTNTFWGSDHEDANEHIEKVLEIIDLFHIPNITIEQVMLRAFHMSLTGAASHWLRNKPSGSITTYEDLKTKTSRTRSTKTSDELASIQAQLNNLGREIKKVNKKVYDAQVGCEQCKGPHYPKDYPLKEEGKTLKEAYYTQFGASVSVMPLSTYLNLRSGKLAHTRLPVELADRIVKYPKGIVENVLVGVANVLAERGATKSKNGEDSHDSRTGVVGLMQWFKKMETVFHISNCTVACQIKFATCTLQGIALTWWNSHVKTVTHDVACAMPWKTLKKWMTHKYSLRGETKKLEIRMLNLKVKESDEIEKYVGGLLDMIHRSVITIAERQAKNKRKLDNNNQAQQQPPKKQGVAIAYTARPGHYKSDFLELKNQNHGNQAGGTGARGMMHALGGGETNQDLNNMKNKINA